MIWCLEWLCCFSVCLTLFKISLDFCVLLFDGWCDGCAEGVPAGVVGYLCLLICCLVACDWLVWVGLYCNLLMLVAVCYLFVILLCFGWCD